MAGSFLIIDGYNLMHAWGLARQTYGPGDLERLRERFLRELAGRLTDEEQKRTTIVFDASGETPADVSSIQKHEKMRVVYAESEVDADTRIEQIIARHSAPRQIRVVSSDRRLQRAARRRRGKFVTSERFVGELQRASPDASSKPLPRELEAKFTGELTETEMAEWLEIFGETDGD